MTVAARQVRGACPGVLRPMESGDGLIVRVRPRAATLTFAQARGLADVAQRHGNGHIDLTRRANLQIRGVTATALGELQDDLARLDLVDANADAEAVRNIVVSPLAGADPGEVLDVRPLARALEHEFLSDRDLWQLPGKFGFLLDGGGALSMAGERADVRLKAVHAAGRVAVSFGLDRADAPLRLGTVDVVEAVATTRRIALAYLETQPPGSRVRMRDLSPDGLDHVHKAVAPLFEHGGFENTDACGGRSIGVLRRDGKAFAVGVALPFGRIEADDLTKFADAVAAAGGEEIRVSPWRTIYAAVGDEAGALQVLDAARELGFITDRTDPLLGIEACPGMLSCRSGLAGTRGAAHIVARMRTQFEDVSTIHISGCSKGCACPNRADLVLVGTRDGFGVMRDARAGDAPGAVLKTNELLLLPAIVARLAREGRHA